MKDIYNVITNHKSIRDYSDQPVKAQDLDKILTASIHAPSSINGQQWSIIVVKDPTTREKLAQLAGGQPWIAAAPVFLLYVADYRKVADSMADKKIPFKNIESIEATMVGSVDVGIAFANAMNVAESLGYGIVPIGGIRRSPYDIIQLFDLPQYVYPIVGMCIGVPADHSQPIKPRMPFDMVIHQEKYQPASLDQIRQYDDTVRKYMTDRTDGQEIRSWSDTTDSVYANVYFPLVKPSLEQQGFTNKY